MALEFTLNLAGNFSGALEKSNKTLGEHTKKAHEAEHALEAFEGELGKVRAGALSLNFNAFQEGGHFLQFDLAEAAAIAYEAIEKLVDKVIDLGKEILKTSGEAEDLNLAIKLDVGDEGLEKVSELAESFRNTRFDDKAIKESLLPLLEESGDDHNDQWDDLITAATDVATRRKTGVNGAKAALEALRGIEIQPQKIRGSLKELGIKQVDFYNDLGALLGISAKSAEAQVKAGQIKAKTLLSVALHQIAEREGGALGIATNAGAETLGTTLERFANLKENLLESLAGSPGLKEFQHALDGIVNTIGGPLGQKAMASADKLFGAIGRFTAAHSDAAFEKIASALDTMSSMIDGTNESWNSFKETMGVVVDVVSFALGPFLLIERAFLAMGGAFLWAATKLDVFLFQAIDAVSNFAEPIYNKALDLGTAIWHGIRDGIVDGVKYVGDALDNLGQSAIDAVRNKLHIHSPSVVFEEMGGNVAAGFARGIDGGGARVAEASERSMGREAVIAAGGASGNVTSVGGTSIHYAPVFQIAAGTPAEVRHQMEEAEQQNRFTLQKVLIEVGVAVGVPA